jgi:hypothetical protein
MLFFKTTDRSIKGDLLAIADENDAGTEQMVCRWDFKTFADAVAMAKKANEFHAGQETYIATDAGASCSPRYDVQTVPKVGDKVSYTFNGDYYPCGKVVSVGTGAKMVIKTDTGAKFYRRRLTGNWVKEGGAWSLVAGHVKRWNPEY